MYICDYVTCCFIVNIFNYLFFVFIADATKKLHSHVEITITQTRLEGWPPLVDGIKVRLTCTAVFNKDNSVVDMWWTGVGVQKSVWVQQTKIMKQKYRYQKELHFRPWLELHAGKYTCHLAMRAADKHIHEVNKTIEVKGKFFIF